MDVNMHRVNNRVGQGGTRKTIHTRDGANQAEGLISWRSKIQIQNIWNVVLTASGERDGSH